MNFVFNNSNLSFGYLFFSSLFLSNRFVFTRFLFGSLSVSILSLSVLSSLFRRLLVFLLLAQIFLDRDRPREVNTRSSKFQQTRVFAAFKGRGINAIIELHVDSDFSIFANSELADAYCTELLLIHTEFITIRFLMQIDHLYFDIRHFVNSNNFHTACRFTRFKVNYWF